MYDIVYDIDLLLCGEKNIIMNGVQDKFLQDLEIDNKILPSINNTITLYGSAKLRELFTNIYFDPNLLLRRRELLQNIINKRINVKKIKKNLINLKKYHDDIVWLFSPIDKNYEELYFTKDLLNTKELLTTNNFLKTYSPSIIIIVYLLIYLVVRYNGININIKDYLAGIYESYKMFIAIILNLMMSGEYVISFLTSLLTTLYVFYQLYQIYNSMDNSVCHYYKCSDFSTKIKNVKEFIINVNNIYKSDIFFINEKELLKNNLDEINDLFDDKKIKSLGYNLLIKKNSLMYEQKFNSLLQYVGLLDAFINVSDLALYKNYTFPEFNFDKDNGPSIICNNLWNPLLNYDSQVKNDCLLGNPNNIILTGPNTSGKSTYIRSIMLSVFLAQTLGVTCADSLNFTPFTNLFTYLDIPNISRDKESLFEAEVQRCTEYCNILERSNKQDFCFTVIDELFTGTNPKEGIASSYAVCDWIGKFDNSLNIITTHFTELTKLGDENEKFKNMKFTVIKKQDGSFERPYIIQNGKSEQNIAIELLKNKGYNNSIIENALTKLKELLNIDKTKGYKFKEESHEEEENDILVT